MTYNESVYYQFTCWEHNRSMLRANTSNYWTYSVLQMGCYFSEFEVVLNETNVLKEPMPAMDVRDVQQVRFSCSQGQIKIDLWFLDQPYFFPLTLNFFSQKQKQKQMQTSKQTNKVKGLANRQHKIRDTNFSLTLKGRLLAQFPLGNLCVQKWGHRVWDMHSLSSLTLTSAKERGKVGNIFPETHSIDCAYT